MRIGQVRTVNLRIAKVTFWILVGRTLSVPYLLSKDMLLPLREVPGEAKAHLNF